MKKTFITLLASLACSLSAFADNPGVTFLLRSGQKVSFAFVEKPVVAFSEDNLAVSVHGVERVSYAYADVQRVVIEDNVISAVDKVVANSEDKRVVFLLSDQTLSVSGIAAGEKISLYATDGKLVLSQNANVGGNAIINLSTFQQGVYVVYTQNGISYKLLKK